MNRREALGEYANEQQRSVQQIRYEAESIVWSYLEATGRSRLFDIVARPRP